MSKRAAILILCSICALIAQRGGAAQPPATQPSARADVTTLQNVKIQGSLDLETGVPIRWKKPDGSGYINVFMLDKDGTLQLCHDPYYWDFPRTKPPAGMGKEFEDLEHRVQRTIEVRNPNTNYPDLRLLITQAPG